MKRVLLTGASGFIGRPLAAVLESRDYEVHAVSSRRHPSNDRPDVRRYHQADLLDPAVPRELVGRVKPSHLMHLAWYTEHGEFWQSPRNLPWAEASIRLWREFAAGGGRRAVMVGSCAEYEWSQPVLSERSTPTAPRTLYGVCKDAVRRVVLAAASSYEVPTAWARLFFVYGPGEHSARLVPATAESLLMGRTARSTGGEQVRDFIHVEDTARALADLLDSDLQGPLNVGSGEGHTVREVVESIAAIAGRPDLVALGALERPDWDPESLVADTSRLRKKLGFRPSFSLQVGLESTVEWLRQNQ